MFTLFRSLCRSLGFVIGSLMLGVVLGNPLPAIATLIADGGFEAPGMTDVAEGVGNSLNVTGTTIGAWTFSATPTTALLDGNYFNIPFTGGVGDPPTDNAAFEGRQYVAFNGGDVFGGSMSQSFATVTGVTYEVTFSITGAVGSSNSFGPHQHQIIADLTGAGPSLGSLTQAATNNVWTTHSLLFTADSATSTLSFSDDLQVGGIGSDMLLDGVSVAAVVPEPATGALLALGLLSMSIIGMRRRRR